MTVAAKTRSAVRDRPFLHTALRAGILNYTASARFLDIGEPEAVAAALRRYAEELDDYDPRDRRVSVSMQSGISRSGDGSTPEEGILSVSGETFAADGGALTAIVGSGEIGAATLEPVLGRLRTDETQVVAAGAGEGSLVVVVDRRAGPDAVRAIENAL